MDWFKENLSMTIALSALVLSILSPIFSSIITGIFRIKEKKLEIAQAEKQRKMDFYISHRAEIIEKYLRMIGRATRHNNIAGKLESGELIGEIYLYVDEELWPLLDEIEKAIEDQQYRHVSTILIDLSKKLSCENIRYQK